jgi:hypothetical protein
MCQAILDAHEARVRQARQRHLDAVADADKALAAELRRLETIKASAEADKARLAAMRVERQTGGAPFVLRKMGEFYTKQGHWIAEPDEATYTVERYEYRAVADRKANLFDGAEVRTWAQYLAEQEERRYARPKLGPKPQMPDTDPYTDKAGWDAYQAASIEWERKKFEGDTK